MKGGADLQQETRLLSWKNAEMVEDNIQASVKRRCLTKISNEKKHLGGIIT